MRDARSPLRVLIADDEAPARRQLRRVLTALEGVDLVGEACDGLEALRHVESLRPDVLILDIQMPELGGLEVAANLDTPAPQLIFATAFDEHAIRAFDLAAVDYLLKPWDAERLLRALDRARERLGRREASVVPRLGPLRRMLVRRDGILHVIDSDEIVRIEAQDNYVMLHATTGDWLLREPLSALLDRLRHPDIVRTHRSHAVNLRHARALIPSTNGDSDILLANGQRVPLPAQLPDRICQETPAPGPGYRRDCAGSRVLRSKPFQPILQGDHRGDAEGIQGQFFTIDPASASVGFRTSSTACERGFMEPQVFVSFVLATATMIALPGPSVLLTVAHSLSFGWRRALITVSGATLGIALQLLVAVIGIGSLIKFVATTFDVLRWAGAGYLIYFGVKVWLNARDLAAFGKGVDVRPNRLLMQGLAVTVFNPKSLLFIAAFLPQFVDASRPVETQFLIIAPVFLVITFVVTSGWAVVSGAVNNVIKNPDTLAVIFRVASALIVVSGISMVVVRRGA